MDHQFFVHVLLMASDRYPRISICHRTRTRISARNYCRRRHRPAEKDGKNMKCKNVIDSYVSKRIKMRRFLRAIKELLLCNNIDKHGLQTLMQNIKTEEVRQEWQKYGGDRFRSIMFNFHLLVD